MEKAQKVKIDWSKIPILNERPEGMEYEDYKLHQKAFKYIYKLYRLNGINQTYLKPDDKETTTESRPEMD